MKKIIKRGVSICLCVLLLLGNGSVWASADDYEDGYEEDFYALFETIIDSYEYIGVLTVVNCTDGVSLREFPDSDSDRVAYVPKWDTVDAFYFDESWELCIYGNRAGFIETNYLTDWPEKYDGYYGSEDEDDYLDLYCARGSINESLEGGSGIFFETYDMDEIIFCQSQSVASTGHTEGWTVATLLTSAGYEDYVVANCNEYVNARTEADTGSQPLYRACIYPQTDEKADTQADEEADTQTDEKACRRGALLRAGGGGCSGSADQADREPLSLRSRGRHIWFPHGKGGEARPEDGGSA